MQVDGIKNLVELLAIGNYREWDLVLNNAEGLYGLARVSQVPYLLEAYGIPFTFADAATTALCLDKGKTKVRCIVGILLYAKMLIAVSLDGPGAFWYCYCTFRYNF